MSTLTAIGPSLAPTRLEQQVEGDATEDCER
jgi:hypothetical protein